MDLREYAISQKIQGKSDLLNYVVNNKDVPVDVLETSFRDLLTEQTDAHVADISNDYIKYLKERVKVGIIPLGDHKFEVSGDISDNELEAIELKAKNLKIARTELIRNLVVKHIDDFNYMH